MYVLDITVIFMLNKHKRKEAAETSPESPQTPLGELSRKQYLLLHSANFQSNHPVMSAFLMVSHFISKLLPIQLKFHQHDQFDSLQMCKKLSSMVL